MRNHERAIFGVDDYCESVRGTREALRALIVMVKAFQAEVMEADVRVRERTRESRQRIRMATERTTF